MLLLQDNASFAHISYLQYNLTIGGSRGANGAEAPLNFFRYVSLTMVLDTEKSIRVMSFV